MVMTLEQAIAGGKTAIERLPGGDAPDRFDPLEAWYPVFYVRDLDQSKPQRFTLLDIDLVLWFEPSSQTWRAMLDRCPHRLATLSEGRINADGVLECPYHGWTFAGSGECQTIPQQAGLCAIVSHSGAARIAVRVSRCGRQCGGDPGADHWATGGNA
jgi:phenylpropionate dioxygenase-like ring-hydroxylating dioxygenase large terminal subunit